MLGASLGDEGRIESAEAMIATALSAAGEEATLGATLETFDAPIYVTDADGWVTSFNRACIDFAGRTPVIGRDRWCVTWRLYTERGDYLPHDQCPMAVAIKEGRKVRGALAVAERPDGTRVMFIPLPTPIVDRDGALSGAVNLLIDLTDARQADALEAQAARCTRLALAINDPGTVETLSAMAADYRAKAGELRRP